MTDSKTFLETYKSKSTFKYDIYILTDQTSNFKNHNAGFQCTKKSPCFPIFFLPCFPVFLLPIVALFLSYCCPLLTLLLPYSCLIVALFLPYCCPVLVLLVLTLVIDLYLCPKFISIWWFDIASWIVSICQSFYRNFCVTGRSML